MAKYAGPDDIAGVTAIAAPESERFAVRRMARLLSVSTSGYYAYVKRCAATVLTPREQRRADLEVRIVQAHKHSGGTYGSLRITAELRDGIDHPSHSTALPSSLRRAVCELLSRSRRHDGFAIQTQNE